MKKTKKNKSKKQRQQEPPQLLQREITPQIRIIDPDQGLVDYVASDESVDSYEEIILANGWKFDRFQKNAPFLDSHSMWGIRSLLGRVESWDVKDGQLIERVRWAIDVEENTEAKLGFRMVERGYLKAVSVGFIPETWSRRSDGEEFTQALDQVTGLDNASRDKVRTLWTSQQQIELSACCIGANANAVTAAFKAHDISEHMLAVCGIGDDEFEVLSKAAAVLDNDDATAAAHKHARLAGTLAFDAGRQKISAARSTNNQSPPASAGGRASSDPPRSLPQQTLRTVLAELESIGA